MKSARKKEIGFRISPLSISLPQQWPQRGIELCSKLLRQTDKREPLPSVLLQYCPPQIIHTASGKVQNVLKSRRVYMIFISAVGL